jgi:hypothetical protein
VVNLSVYELSIKNEKIYALAPPTNTIWRRSTDVCLEFPYVAEIIAEYLIHKGNCEIQNGRLESGSSYNFGHIID